MPRTTSSSVRSRTAKGDFCEKETNQSDGIKLNGELIDIDMNGVSEIHIPKGFKLVVIEDEESSRFQIMHENLMKRVNTAVSGHSLFMAEVTATVEGWLLNDTELVKMFAKTESVGVVMHFIISKGLISTWTFMSIVAAIPTFVNFFMGGDQFQAGVNTTSTDSSSYDNYIVQMSICNVPPGQDWLLLVTIGANLINGYIFFKFCNWCKKQLEINYDLFTKEEEGSMKTSASENTVVISHLPRELDERAAQIDLKMLMTRIVLKQKLLEKMEAQGYSGPPPELEAQYAHEESDQAEEKLSPRDTGKKILARWSHTQLYHGWNQWRSWVHSRSNQVVVGVHIAWDSTERYVARARLQASQLEEQRHWDTVQAALDAEQKLGLNSEAIFPNPLAMKDAAAESLGNGNGANGSISIAEEPDIESVEGIPRRRKQSPPRHRIGSAIHLSPIEQAQAAQESREAVEAEIAELGPPRCAGIAFVTFQRVEDAMRAFLAYRDLSLSYRMCGWNCRCCIGCYQGNRCVQAMLPSFSNDFHHYDRFLRCQYPAPEPKDIIWHNLNFRRHMTMSCKIGNLVVSFTLIALLVWGNVALLHQVFTITWVNMMIPFVIIVVKHIIFLLFYFTTQCERAWTMSELELSLGTKIVVGQLAMTYCTYLASKQTLDYDPSSCDWYHVGNLFVTNSLYCALINPLLEYLRIVDWIYAHPRMRWICCYDPHNDIDQMFPAYVISLYKWYTRLLYMITLCITFGGIFPIMYWFGLLEIFLCYHVDRHNLIHAYAQCPRYDTSICKSIILALPICLLGNAVCCLVMMALWESSHDKHWPYFVGYGATGILIVMALFRMWRNRVAFRLFKVEDDKVQDEEHKMWMAPNSPQRNKFLDNLAEKVVEHRETQLLNPDIVQLTTPGSQRSAGSRQGTAVRTSWFERWLETYYTPPLCAQANPEPTGNEETGFVSYVVMRDTSESKNPFQQIMNFLGVCPFPDPIAQVRSEAQA